MRYARGVDEPKIRITVGGKLAMTINEAAERHGLAPVSIRTLIKRTGYKPDAHLDGKPLFIAARFDKFMASRPGRGNWRHGTDDRP